MRWRRSGRPRGDLGVISATLLGRRSAPSWRRPPRAPPRRRRRRSPLRRPRLPEISRGYARLREMTPEDDGSPLRRRGRGRRPPARRCRTLGDMGRYGGGMGRSGEVWGDIGTRPGAGLGRSGRDLGEIWARGGAIWGDLGRSEAIWGDLGEIWGDLARSGERRTRSQGRALRPESRPKATRGKGGSSGGTPCPT